MLPHLLEQLELCQKSLSAYLETKRAEFPRFYFVSDPTLLEILSLGSDPPSVVPHFQSGLFDSLTNVSFDKVDKTKMLEMFSQQGEKVEFERPVEAKGVHMLHSALPTTDSMLFSASIQRELTKYSSNLHSSAQPSDISYVV